MATHSPKRTEKRLLYIDSPKIKLYSNGSYGRHIKAKDALTKRVQKVSQRAAAVGKQKIWDSNDASIDAAQSAVDQWENAYTAFRSLLIRTAKSAVDVYDTAKVGASRIEHSLLVPVRDTLILPAFAGAEKVALTTIHFLHSDEVTHLANSTLTFVRKTPFVGESIVAPALVHTFYLIKNVWDIVQYPIPSRETVRCVVDTSLTSAKWALSTASRETYFYVKLVDASITRTLMHTQWKILGSGPYASLVSQHKAEVLDHLCERYLSYSDRVNRYELAAHIKRQNQVLYDDLISSGLLKRRGQEATDGDAWLDTIPIYRSIHPAPLFVPKEKGNSSSNRVGPLWFYNSYHVGDKVIKDPYWTCFNAQDIINLESRYQSQLSYMRQGCDESMDPESFYNVTESTFQQNYYATQAKWYDPDLKHDLLVEQNRYAVSFIDERLHQDLHGFGERVRSEPYILHPISFRMRPTLWRFHGDGNDVRRATWLLDTHRYGLQPYSNDSSAVLEDAFLFLRWLMSNNTIDDYIDSILLTVSVVSPDDGEEQLVQFRFLKQIYITAIPKKLGSGFSIFKRRVYRGVIQSQRPNHENLSPRIGQSMELDAAAPIELLSSGNLRGEFYGECEEATHLVLVVHGIGETLRSISSGDLYGLALPPSLSATLIDNVDCLRKNHSQILSTYSWNHNGHQRVEYLPVEWHDAFTIHSRRSPTSSQDNLDETINGVNELTTMSDISVKTIQSTRNLVNNTILDILYYMSPIHHETMLDIVIREMNLVVHRFKNITKFDGKISVLAHSLGSIITWDILLNYYNQRHHQPGTGEQPAEIICHTKDRDMVPRKVEAEEIPLKSTLDFDVDNAFMIGSPIAVFLMLRNSTIGESFSLPGCSRIFNIFHPYDPVAYRIEPLIDRRNSQMEPMIIPTFKGGYRLQYQTRLLWQTFIDIVLNTQKIAIRAFENKLEQVGLLGTQNETEEEDDNDSLSVLSGDSSYFLNCGILCEGRRIDYMLQEREIENANEYLFSIMAHSSYWREKDMSFFIARRIVRASTGEIVDSVSI